MYQRFSKYQAGTPCLATKNLKFDPLLCQIFRSLSGVVFRTWYQSFILQFLLASAAFSKTRWNGLSQLLKALGCQFNGSSLRPVYCPKLVEFDLDIIKKGVYIYKYNIYCIGYHMITYDYIQYTYKNYSYYFAKNRVSTLPNVSGEQLHTITISSIKFLILTSAYSTSHMAKTASQGNCKHWWNLQRRIAISVHVVSFCCSTNHVATRFAYVLSWCVLQYISECI